jgi:hypothetical protein
MKSLEWRDYMRELLKMSDEAIMKTLRVSTFQRDLAEKWACGVDFTYPDGTIADEPAFSLDRSLYIEVIPKIKVEFECEKDVHFFMSYTSSPHHHHEVTLRFKCQSEQEEVFNKLKSAFGG